MKDRGQHTYINFCINFMILLKLFDSGVEKNMRKDAHPSSGMDS